MKIQGTGVIVTGASRGLGAALVRALARKGARVVLVAREANALEEVARGIRAAGGEAWSVPADIGDKEAIHRIAGVAAAVAGPIDLLINNAATLGPLPMPLLADTECEALERVLAVNLVGAFRLTKVVIGSMLLRQRGLVVNVSSDAAIVGYSGWGAYGISKAGLEQMGRIWATELQGTGVRMVTVDPGEMDTQMHAEAVPDADRQALADPGEAARWTVNLIERIGEIRGGERLERGGVVADPNGADPSPTRTSAEEGRPREPTRHEIDEAGVPAGKGAP